MGTRVIFYEELADDMSETWDVFDSIFKDKLRIRAYPSTEPFHHPVQSIHLILIFLTTIPFLRCTLTEVFCTRLLHQSHTTRRLAIPPFSSFAIPWSCLRPLWRRRCLTIPLCTFLRDLMAMIAFRGIGEPYDPLEDYDGLFAQYFQDPQGGAVAPMEEDPDGDPMYEDQPGEEELSAGLRAGSAGGRSELSTDTRESYA
ncbi:hypothetical protein PIB30_080770 [Stylosanthes scabra]|uniref:Uncharacterized protein n=1 Tax=Stylosanthes scabra TaxID=79078 RepID=A0ABU6RRT0_9FABA|nr:hypothetical protein [Stylosanthes scabra]